MPLARGSEQMFAIAAGCRNIAGGGPIKLSMVRALRAATVPMKDAAAESARRRLPHKGGLDDYVAEQKITTSVLTSARSAGVRLRCTVPATGQTDQGFVRHPLPRNNRARWFTEDLPAAAGWWSDSMAASSVAVTPVVVGVIAKAATDLQAAVRGA